MFISCTVESLYYRYPVSSVSSLFFFSCSSSHEFTDTPAGSSDVVVAMNSFKSKIIRIKVYFIA